MHSGRPRQTTICRLQEVICLQHKLRSEHEEVRELMVLNDRHADARARGRGARSEVFKFARGRFGKSHRSLWDAQDSWLFLESQTGRHFSDAQDRVGGTRGFARSLAVANARGAFDDGMPPSKEALNKRVYRAMQSKAERDAHNAARNARRAAARAKDAQMARADPRAWSLVLEERRARARAIKQAQRDAARQRRRASRQPEGGSEPGDANAPAPVPPRYGPWARAGDREFGGLPAKVYSGVQVKPEYAAAARYMLNTQPAKRDSRARDVEGERSRYSWLYTDRSWTAVARRYKDHLRVLQTLEKVLSKRATKHVGNIAVELYMMIARVYSGGPTGALGRSKGETVRTHTDNVFDRDGGEDTRDVVSVVFVLEGGFSDSGFDVRILDQPKEKEFFPHLEKGDMLLLKGGSCGVAHDVDFHGDPEREDWRERLTVVAFYAVGREETGDARTSAAGAG